MSTQQNPQLVRESVAEFAASVWSPSPATSRPRITYEEVAWALSEIEASPRATITRGGESVRGEPIWKVEVEPPDGAPEATTFVVGGIHAMEHAGVAAALSLLRRASAPTTPWRRHRLVAIPLANPDGFRQVEADLAAGRVRFRRHNARGVDLNRNFPVGYRRVDGAWRPLSRLQSSGAGPLSEPEAQAVDAALASCTPDYAVSLHAFGNWIFLPYTGKRQRPAGYSELVRIARGMADRQPGGGYRIAQVGRLAPVIAARGSELDHMYDTYGARAFLLEIGSGPRPFRPKSWLSPYAWFNAEEPQFHSDVERAVAAVEHLSEGA